MQVVARGDLGAAREACDAVVAASIEWLMCHVSCPRGALPLARVSGAQRPNFFHKFRYFPPKFRETFGEI